MQNLLGPFGDEAVAAFITAILSAIIAYWLYQRSKQKPNIILCEQYTQLELIRYGLAEALPFSYGDKVLQKPWLIRMWLVNVGSAAIKQPAITFEVAESVKMLTPRFEIEPKRQLQFANVEQKSPNSVTITLDYLNPRQPHKENLLVDLICDGEVDEIKVFGSGEGWSVQYRTLHKALRTAFSYAIFGLLILTLSFIIFVVTLTKNILTDASVSQALLSLWKNRPIQLSTFALIGAVILTAILALLAERKSGIPFYRPFFYLLPKSFLQAAVNVIFKNRLPSR